MSRAQSGIELVIATRNAHKVEEIRAILGGDFAYRTLNDFPGAPKVVEDANTFAGNATKKARELAQWLGAQGTPEGFVLADDSGLEVDALGGAPGVHSARFALMDEGTAPPAENAIDTANNAKLLRLLKEVPIDKRTARFRCVIAFARIARSSAENRVELFEGACEGRISFAPSGQKGFGYDPLFVPLGYQESFAELGESVKNQMSHRAMALEKLKEFLAGK
jgi:XTP/dITP diphosphohydrolase